MKILIVEDNEQDQKIVKRYLTKAGYEDLQFAGSGEDGVAWAAKNKPNVVVTDTNLPGIDGFEVCRSIRQLPGFTGTVIVVTGSIDAVDAGRARQMGADDYCVKTSDCSPLLAAIKNCLTGHPS